MGRQEYFPLFPGFWEEATGRLGRHPCQLLFEAYVPPREKLHFFFPKAGSQKKLEQEKILWTTACKEPLQLFGAVGLGDAFHVARPVPAPQEPVAPMRFEHLLHDHHLRQDRPRRYFFLLG